jgi:hypothetical protein
MTRLDTLDSRLELTGLKNSSERFYYPMYAELAHVAAKLELDDSGSTLKKDGSLQDLLIYKVQGDKVALFLVEFERYSDGKPILNSDASPKVRSMYGLKEVILDVLGRSGVVSAKNELFENDSEFHLALYIKALTDGYALMEARTDSSDSELLAKATTLHRYSFLRENKNRIGTDWKNQNGFVTYWKRPIAVGPLPQFTLE